ncbi:hypothetical protein J6590_082807 [Homalodisca vitripennis]|nr:hypothetical protein J6590_082807 [Homalodisca vitripennis]
MLYYLLNTQVSCEGYLLSCQCVRPTGHRRRHLVTFLAFLGIFMGETLKWTFVNSIDPITTPYEVTLDNGTVVEESNLDFDMELVSHVMSSSFYGYVATQILGGWLGACLGGSRVFGVGVAFTALFSLIMPFVVQGGAANWVIACRVIQGLFEGVTYSSIIAVWSRWAPPQERARLVTIAFSGIYFSIVINPPVCRLIANTLGWTIIFHITGILGFIWFAVWWAVVKDKPEDDPHISTEELKYLRDNLDCGPNDSIPKHIIYPWDKFVTSMPVWAIVVAHTCVSYGFISLSIVLPMYMRDAYHYEIDTTGLLSYLPYLLIAFLMPVAGTLADWLRNSEVLTTTQVSNDPKGRIQTPLCLSIFPHKFGPESDIQSKMRGRKLVVVTVSDSTIKSSDICNFVKVFDGLKRNRHVHQLIRLQNPVGLDDISLVSQTENNLTVAFKGDLATPPSTELATRSELRRLSRLRAVTEKAEMSQARRPHPAKIQTITNQSATGSLTLRSNVNTSQLF